MSEAIFNLVWLPPVLPFLAFVLIVLWAHRSKKLSAGLAIGAIGAAWVVSWLMAFTAFRTDGLAEDPFRIFRDWIPTGSTWHSFGLAIDPLTAVMLSWCRSFASSFSSIQSAIWGWASPWRARERGIPPNLAM
jgi:NADH:ubiquinone oxidoreductase subunit 5 (subunit L)/multisubunit Na+/H+ antiporter MnhA subunit